MSDAVFPQLPGLAWGVTKTPMWKTITHESVSGMELRATAMAYPRYRISMRYEVLRETDGLAELQQLIGFFNARRGSWDDFLWLDPDDNTASNTLFGTGDGSTRAFRLSRSFGGFREPVQAFNGKPQLFIDGNPAGGNLIANGSFELDGNADGMANGWELFTSGGVATPYYGLATSIPVLGNKAQRVGTNFLDPSSQLGVYQNVDITGYVGQQLTFSGYLRRSDVGTSVFNLRIYLEWRDAANANVVGAPLSSIVASSLSWQRLSLTGTPPAGAAIARVFFIAFGVDGNSMSLDIDAAQLVPGSTPTDVAASDRHWVQGANGLVTFDTAPPNGAALTWSGQFYKPARFLRDETDFDQFLKDLWSAKKVELLTVKRRT